MYPNRLAARLALLATAVGGVLLVGWPRAGPRPAAPHPALWPLDADVTGRVRAIAARLLDELDTALAHAEAVDAANARESALDSARLAFRRSEALLAFYAPEVRQRLNSTEADEGDDDPDAGRLADRGFARLRTLGQTRLARDSARAELRRMRAALARARATFAQLETGDALVLEVTRLEVARVSTIGITGADAAHPRRAMRECAAAIDGLRGLLATMRMGAASLDARLDSATKYLGRHQAVDTFDRYVFLTRYAAPVFTELAAAQQRAPGPSLPLRRVWPRAATNPLDGRSLDPMAFAPLDAPRSDSTLVSLGARLFRDPALSGDGQRSCASCHQPARGFTDGLARAQPIAAALDDVGVMRHTPRLAYAGWQPTQFADGRAATLERQVDLVLASRTEMRSSTEAAAGRLGLAPRVVRTALAAYVRSLGRFDAPFDRAMRGDSIAMGLPERRGFNLFMGRAGCGSCHVPPLFNGTAPPAFVASPPEVIGVPSRAGARDVDPDSGRAGIDRLAGHLHAFTTPRLRNAALGGPYMHNGALRDLDAVLDFYDRGGAAGRGVPLPTQTLDPHPLHLSRADRHDLVAFLHALVDGPSYTMNGPSSLP